MDESIDKSKKTILIADDDEDTILILSEVFSKEGYDIKCASNGKDALEILLNNKIDLIITDLKMPKMDGMELLRNIVERDLKVSIILMTAYAEIDSYIEARDLGVFEYIQKPVRIVDLKLIVKKALEEPEPPLSNPFSFNRSVLYNN